MTKTFTLFLIFLCFQSVAQDRYVVQLTDKNNSPFSVGNPSAFLSARSILRRTNQNIPVTLNDLPVNPSYINGVAAVGAAIIGHSKWLNTITIQTTSMSVLNAINALPYVASVNNVGRMANNERNAPGKFDKEKLFTNDTYISTGNRTESFDYGPSLNQVQMLGGDMMHNNGYTGNGKIIAVLDAGFSNADNMVAFDSLRAHNQILGTWDFVSDDTNVYDDNTHGSYVLSLIGGNWPGNIIGTAPGASFWLLRTEDVFTENIIEEYNWAEGAEFADSAGADIISTSLGYTEFDNAAQNHTYSDMNGDTAPITRAADLAASKGMVVCASAGNEGNSLWNFIGAPADADSILTVGAVDASGNYASFSSNGPSFDGRVKPNVAAQGEQAIVADPNNFGVYPGNGTSFSCPIMAGMVATLWECHPNATNMQLISAIQQSASQSTNPDTLLGYGIPDFPMACIILGGISANEINHGDNLVFNGPNPLDNTLQFSFYSDSNQALDIRIYDMLGNIVYSTISEIHPVSVNHYSIPFPYSQGIYVLKIFTEKDSFSRKIVKN